MKKLAIILGALALFVVQPVAGQFVPTEMPAGWQAEETLYYRGLSGFNPIAYNAYTGPYQGAFVPSPGGPVFSMYCVDFSRQVQNGNSWAFTWQGVVSGNDFQVAFLASLFASQETSSFAAIHGAIWYLTDGQAGTSGLFSTHYGNNKSAIDPFLAMASNAWTAWNGGNWQAFNSDFNPAHWYFLTDPRSTADGGRQRFIAQSSYSVPEPGVIVLLLSGLLGVAFVARRRASQLS